MRVPLLVSLLSALAVGVVACGGAAAAPSAAPPGLVQSGSFTVCMDESFPPMEYVNGSATTPSGFDVVAAGAVAKAWGLKPVYKNVDFAGLLPALSSGRCDVAWSAMFVSAARTKVFPAIGYYKTGTVLLVAHGNPKGIHSPADLAGHVLVAQDGTTLLTYAKSLAKKLKAQGKTPPTVQGYPKATDLIQQLVVGRADAALTQDTEAGYRAKQQPGKFQVAYSYSQKETFGIYYRKSTAALGAALKKELMTLKADGTLKRLATKEGLPPAGLSIG